MIWFKLRHYPRVIGRAFEMTLYQNFTDAFILFGILIQPLLIAMLAFWMLQERGGDYIIYVIVGSGMTGLWTTVLFISGNSITGERWTGTLELLVGSPTPLPVVVFGKNLANVLQSLGSMIICYSLAVISFGYFPEVQHPFLFVISLLFAVISYVCFGLVLAAVFIMNPDVQRWQNGLEFPIYILSGFLFPIALLPLWVTPLSYLLAPYWAARALHASSSGGDLLTDIALSWGMMLFYSVVYVLVSRVMFRKLLYRARVEASLGMQ